MQNELSRLMFPDCCYRFVSGGDPEKIPELSYEQFISTHRSFYHPSNSYIFLDGSVDLETVLKIMDEEYLSLFSRKEMDTAIALQKPVCNQSTVYYEISPAEELSGKGRIAWGYGLGDYTSRREVFAMNVLADLLCGSNHAPVKQAILSAGLAEDVSMGVMDGMQQNMVVVNADNIADGAQEQLKNLIEETIRQQLARRLDHEHIRATLANMEMQYRQRDYGFMPQGLGLGSEILNSWLYGGKPGANLPMEPLFRELNELVDTGWYEAFLETTLLHNPHCCQVLLLPSYTAGQQRQRAECDRLAKAEANWSAAQKAALQAQQQRLDAWQESCDTPEDIAKLPALEISDISLLPEDVPTEVFQVSGVTVLHHEIATGGISYWNLYFDISELDEAALADAAFLCQALSNLGTAQFSPLELQKRFSSVWVICGLPSSISAGRTKRMIAEFSCVPVSAVWKASFLRQWS